MNYEIACNTIKSCIEKNSVILIGADFVPTLSNKDIFIEGNLNKLVGNELEKIFKMSDLNILNLEVPITFCDKKIRKAGSPNLKTYPEALNILKNMNPLVVSGANNHIFDYSQEGISDTISYLDENNILHVGFGKDYESARESLIVKINGLKIGIYSCSENEFSCANKSHGGGNGYDPLVTFDDINQLKLSCDYAIVLFHGGRENYRYPSVQLKRICQKMVDKGADLVVCQHSHCIGVYETYKGSCIVYGQGNVLFDYNDIEEWRSSILLQLIFSKEEVRINIIPIEKVNERVKMSGDNGNIVISDFLSRSEKAKNIEFLEEEFHRFNTLQKNIILLRGVMGINNKLILALNKILKGRLLNCMFKEKRKLLLLNYIRCESIRESLMDLLEDEEE